MHKIHACASVKITFYISMHCALSMTVYIEIVFRRLVGSLAIVFIGLTLNDTSIRGKLHERNR